MLRNCYLPPLNRAARGLLIMLAALLITTCSQTAAAEPEGRPALLFIGKPGVYMETTYLDELEAHGFDVFAGQWSEITPHVLRRYHAVVISSYGFIHADQRLNQERQRYIEEYMRAGGGVLFILNTSGGYHEEGLGDIPDFLKTFGIDFYAEAIRDAGTETPMSPPALQRYGSKVALARKIAADHPVTRGVEAIWYPVGWGGHAQAAATPVNTSHQWQSLVETAPTAELQIAKQVPQRLWRDKRPDGPYSLLSVRQVDAGRMAVLGVAPQWIVWTPYYPPLGEVVMKKGEKGVPSDFWKLLENTYAWLAQPSLDAGLYGPDIAKRPPIARDTPTVAWDQMDFPGKPTGYYRGVCGAHTTYSTGTGTVAEWVEAAKRNGFDFLIFAEDLVHMNQEKWESLQADCLAASDENFIACAGLEYQNASGNRGFLPWGNKRPWISGAYLTDDGKQINVDRGWSPQKGHGATDHKSGQIQLWLEQKCTGYFDHESNQAPFWDYKLYNMFTVWSYERGKPLDDALDKLLHANSLHVNPRPYALDLMFSPEELDGAAKNGRPFLVTSADNDPRMPEQATLERVFKRFVVSDPEVPDRQVYRSWVGPVATQGPKLRLLFRGGYRWMGIEFPRYWIERHQGIETRDWFMDSWYRLKVRLDAESEAGLADITIYDGETLIRRFDPKGATDFTVDFDLLQDQNRHLAAVVTDKNGHRAVSNEIWMEQQQRLYNYCGDRVNVPLSIYSPIHGGPTYRHIRLKRGRIDDKALRANRTPRDEVRRFFVDLVSPDVLIERYRTDWVYHWDELTDQHGWHNWAPHHERDDYTLEQRGYEYYNRHGQGVSHKSHHTQKVYWDGFGEATADMKEGPQPAELHVFEHELTLKKPLELDANGFFAKTVIESQAPEAVEYALIEPGGGVIRGTVNKDTESTMIPIPSGSVLTMQSTERGESIQWQGDDLAFRVAWEDDHAVVESGVHVGDRNRAGETFTWRFQRIDRAVDVEQVLKPEWFALKTGQLDGLPLCELHVKAENGAAAILLKEAAFDTNMQPIIVDGVNPNASAFLYRKDQGLIRPVGVYDKKAFCQVPATLKGTELVVGNLLTTDYSELHITTVRETDDRGEPTGVWMVEAHNPTDREITAILAPAPAFAILEDGAHTVTVAPRSSVDFKVNEK